MSEEDSAPKPSAVRRSGRINYASRGRIGGRPGLNPPANRRMTAAQQKYAEAVRRKNPAPPKVDSPNTSTEEVVDDDAIDTMLSQTFEDEEDTTEEKKLDTPDPTPTPAILEDKLLGYEDEQQQQQPQDPPVVVENEPVDPPPQNSNDKPDEEPPAAAADQEEPAPASRKPARSRRVYHRPHTNQTVTLAKSSSSNNDDDSMTSGLSQPSWTGRPTKTEEEEEDDEELSQTSLGNSKRRARMKSRRKKQRVPKRSSSAEQPSSSNLGYVVSQAFDNLLGYAGGQTHRDDDEMSYSTKGSENIVDGWQEAILSTLGCAVPHNGMTMKTMNTFDDTTTVESNQTGGQSRISTNSSVRHRRSGSNLSGSVFSTGSGVGSVLSFETTEELADFSKDHKRPAQQQQTGGSYKVPDAYETTPPVIPQKEEEQMYSEDLYSSAKEQSDFAPVDLLSEGDNMMESVGKDFFTVANAAVDDVYTSIQTFLSPTMSEDSTANVEAATPPAEPAVLRTTMSNVTEPLQVITETDAEAASPVRKTTIDENEFAAFENFETNVFEKSSSSQAVLESPADPGDPGDLIINETESDASLFQGIDDHETPEDMLPKAETSQEAPITAKDGGIDFNVLMKVSEDNASNLEERREEKVTLSPSSTSIHNQDTDETLTTATSTEKASTNDSIAVDREEAGEPVSEPAPILEEGEQEATEPEEIKPEATEPEASEPIVTEKPIKADVTPVSPSPVEKPEATEADKPTTLKASKKAERASFQAALKAPETKKPKKSMFKKLFGRKKDKKGSKKSSQPLASMTQTPPQEPKEPIRSKSKPEEATAPSPKQVKPKEVIAPSPEDVQPEEAIAPSPEEVKIATPSPQVKESVSTPEPALESAPEEVDPQETELAEVIMEQPDPPSNDASNVGDAEAQASSELPQCPTTPVRDPEGVLNTPKMSNLGLEDRKLTRPVSGTNLADLPGIDEAKSFREDPPASPPVRRAKVDPPASSDGFGLSFKEGGHVAGFEQLQSIETVKSTVSAKSFDEDPKEVSFDSFNLDFGMTTWESFGDNSNDVGHAAFQQKLSEDANKASPQKVSAFPVY